MGNYESSHTDEGQSRDETCLVESQDDNANDSGPDMQYLFEFGSLEKASTNARCEIKKSVLQDQQNVLIDALEKRVDRANATITLGQFCDIFQDQNNFSKEDMVQAFELFDQEGDGVVSVRLMLDTIRSSAKSTFRESLGAVNKCFKSCSVIPGFIDIYSDQVDGNSQLVTRLLDYMLRNRAQSIAVPCYSSAYFNTLSQMRLKVLHSNFIDFASSANKSTTSSENKDIISFVSLQSNKSAEFGSVEDAAILWYIQIVTATTAACLPLAPQLTETILGHTRTALDRMPPLSLAHDASSRPKFITNECKVEIGKFLHSLPSTENQLNISLRFNLVCGYAAGILSTLQEVHGFHKMLNGDKLVRELNDVRKSKIFQPKAYHLKKFTLIACDGKKKRADVKATEVSDYSNQPGQKKLNFVFESQQPAFVTSLQITVEKASLPKFGLVFLLPKDKNSFDIDNDLKTFAGYDSWRMDDYKNLTSQRLNGISGKPEDPVACISFKGDRLSVNVILDEVSVCQRVLIKFIGSISDAEDAEIGAVGVKFSGVLGASSHSYFANQADQESLSKNQTIVQETLSFLTSVVDSQRTRKSNSSKQNYNFIKQQYIDVDQRTGRATYKYQPSEDVGILIAKFPFSEESPFFEIVITDRGKVTAIGVGAVPEDYPFRRMPGWDTGSIGYHADDGGIFIGGGYKSKKLDTCTTGDKMGCGMEFQGDKNIVYFTKNGERVFEKDFPSSCTLHPAIGMHSERESILLVNQTPWRAEKQVSSPKQIGGIQVFTNPEHLDMTGTTIDTFWNAYNAFSEDKLSQTLILNLLHGLLPNLVPGVPHGESNEKLFHHLCSLIDTDARLHDTDSRLVTSAKELITEGAGLFFINQDARRSCLFDLLSSCKSGSNLSGSNLCIFQGLCQYVGTIDPGSLISLPSTITENLDLSDTMIVMDTLMSVSCDNFIKVVKSARDTTTSDDELANLKNSGNQLQHHLLSLINALQTILLTWSCENMKTDDGRHREKIEKSVIRKYIKDFLKHLLSILNELNSMDAKFLVKIVDLIKNSMIASTFPQQILLLSYISDAMTPTLKHDLLTYFLPVVKIIRSLSSKLCNNIPKLSKSKSASNLAKETRMTWEVESPHNYENDQNSTQTYTCLGASEFEIVFDSQCETEDGYDYLEFKPSNGMSVRCDGKVGESKWLTCIKFENCSSIEFSFHSDATGTRWGYKFTITARGVKQENIHWFDDLYLSFSKMLGKFCGQALDASPVLPKATTPDGEAEAELFKSNIWKSIFRGGFIVGCIKMFERSLSGSHGAIVQSEAHDFLCSLNDENKDTEIVQFLDKCRKLAGGEVMQKFRPGGEDVTSTVVAIFAALVWHTQSLREDLEKYVKGRCQGEVSKGIAKAYSTAETLRSNLIEQKQKYFDKLEKAETAVPPPAGSVAGIPDGEKATPPSTENVSSPVGNEPALSAENSRSSLNGSVAQAGIVLPPDNVDSSAPNERESSPAAADSEVASRKDKKDSPPSGKDAYPVTAMKTKAEFLLKFAGLAKVPVDSEGKIKKDLRFQRGRSQSCGDDLIEPSLDKAFETFPSFRMVLDFVRDPAWHAERVEQMMEIRSQHASYLASAFQFAYDFIQSSTDVHIFQMPIVVFFQEILQYQDRFGKHYAAGLDGCGLRLEGQVRRTYYELLHHLCDCLKDTDKRSLNNSIEVECYDTIAVFTLHLLDVKWQIYDLSFLHDLNLPDFYFKFATEYRSTVKKEVVPNYPNLTDEEYQQDMEWLPEAKRTGYLEFRTSKLADNPDHKLEIRLRLFCARYKSLIQAGYQCDGCQRSIERSDQPYRCIECVDVDICQKCFDAGKIPSLGGHNGNHKLVHFNYICNGCEGSIIGTRYHCLVCSDFNLCHGCHKSQHYTDRHNSEHEVTVHHSQEIKQIEQMGGEDVTIEGYIHQHAWMLFCNLAMLTITMLDEDPGGSMDDTHLIACNTLAGRCISTAMSHLLHASTGVPDVADSDVVDSAIDVAKKEEEKTEDSKDEKKDCEFDFGLKILGLLAAVLPPENKSAKQLLKLFVTEEFVRGLFSIATDSGYLTTTQVSALGFVVKLLPRIDANSEIARMAPVPLSMKGCSEMGTNNLMDSIFNFGAYYLSRGEIDKAAFTASILQKLSTIPMWNEREAVHMRTMFENLEQVSSISMLFVFHAFAVAGFPQMPFCGTLLSSVDKNNEEKRGIVSEMFDTTKEINVVDVNTRKIMKVDKSSVHVVSNNLCLLPENTISNVMTTIINLAKDVKPGVGGSSDINKIWSLALFLKAILKMFNIYGCKKNIKISDAEQHQFVKCIVHLASQGTEMSRAWLLNDLEILSLVLYKKYLSSSHASKVEKPVDVRAPTDEAAGSQMLEPSNQSSSVHSDVFHSLESEVETNVGINEAAGNDLTDQAATNNGIDQAARNYDIDLATMDAFPEPIVVSPIATSSESIDNSPSILRDPPVGRRNNVRTESSETVDPLVALLGADRTSDSTIDDSDDEDAATRDDPLTGIEDENIRMGFMMLAGDGADRYVLRAIYDLYHDNEEQMASAMEAISVGRVSDELRTAANQLKEKKNSKKGAKSLLKIEEDLDVGISFTQLDMEILESDVELGDCLDEETLEKMKLMASDEEENLKAEKEKRTNSDRLFEKTLVSKNTREELQELLVKVNRSIAILYSRQVLMGLMSVSELDKMPFASGKTCSTDDLNLTFILEILCSTDTKTQKQVIDNIMKCCKPECLVLMSLTAIVFLDEGEVHITKEMPSERKERISDVVRIPGASCLSVTFDKRCSTLADCQLVLSTSEDFEQNKKTFSGANENWTDFDVLGDTLHFKLEGDPGEQTESSWGYKFTVTGKPYQWNRFETGYVILDVVSKHGSAMKLLPIDRLWKRLVAVTCVKTGNQRLKLIHLLLQFLNSQSKSAGLMDSLAVDLSILSPIWRLYKKLMDSDKPDEESRPSIILALTELFVVVETVAQSWDVEPKYIKEVVKKEIVKAQRKRVVALEQQMKEEEALDADSSEDD